MKVHYQEIGSTDCDFLWTKSNCAIIIKNHEYEKEDIIVFKAVNDGTIKDRFFNNTAMIFFVLNVKSDYEGLKPEYCSIDMTQLKRIMNGKIV